MEKKAASHMYRSTTLGISLADSLRELVNSGEITESAKENILATFD
jgi:hypothetical protein